MEDFNQQDYLLDNYEESNEVLVNVPQNELQENQQINIDKSINRSIDIGGLKINRLTHHNNEFCLKSSFVGIEIPFEIDKFLEINIDKFIGLIVDVENMKNIIKIFKLIYTSKLFQDFLHQDSNTKFHLKDMNYEIFKLNKDFKYVIDTYYRGHIVKYNDIGIRMKKDKYNLYGKYIYLDIANNNFSLENLIQKMRYYKGYRNCRIPTTHLRFSRKIEDNSLSLNLYLNTANIQKDYRDYLINYEFLDFKPQELKFVYQDQKIIVNGYELEKIYKNRKFNCLKLKIDLEKFDPLIILDLIKHKEYFIRFIEKMKIVYKSEDFKKLIKNIDQFDIVNYLETDDPFKTEYLSIIKDLKPFTIKIKDKSIALDLREYGIYEENRLFYFRVLINQELETYLLIKNQMINQKYRGKLFHRLIKKKSSNPVSIKLLEEYIALYLSQRLSFKPIEIKHTIENPNDLIINDLHFEKICNPSRICKNFRGIRCRLTLDEYFANFDLDNYLDLFYYLERKHIEDIYKKFNGFINEDILIEISYNPDKKINELFEPSEDYLVNEDGIQFKLQKSRKYSSLIEFNSFGLIRKNRNLFVEIEFVCESIKNKYINSILNIRE